MLHVLCFHVFIVMYSIINTKVGGYSDNTMLPIIINTTNTTFLIYITPNHDQSSVRNNNNSNNYWYCTILPIVITINTIITTEYYVSAVIKMSVDYIIVLLLSFSFSPLRVFLFINVFNLMR